MSLAQVVPAATPGVELPPRFWAKIDFRGDCWEWKAAGGGQGYGSFNLGPNASKLPHRLIWLTLVGPIQPRLHLDHLCRNTLCVNPDHLQPVPPATNVRRGVSPMAVNARKVVCKRGHPLDEGGAYYRPDRPGGRQCRACQRERRREYASRLVEVAREGRQALGVTERFSKTFNLPIPGSSLRRVMVVRLADGEVWSVVVASS